MTRKLLDCIETQTAQSVEYSVIWLHGLGASGHDFEPIIPELNLLQRPGIRFLFPHAPVRPITINGGAAMRAWYDITSADFDARDVDNIGINESAMAIADLIDNEINRGIPAERIIVAGFSQGGAIALHVGLMGGHRLGGILALSCYLPMPASGLEKMAADRKTMPIFMAHGTQDDVIRLQHAEHSRDLMQTYGITLEWHQYSMPHSVSADEVRDIEIWLKLLFGM